MHKVIIDGVDLSQDYIIGQVSYPTYSKYSNYKERAGTTPAFFYEQDDTKLVEITFTKKEQCQDPLELQHEMEQFIANTLRNKEPSWVEVDGRWMFAKLDGTGGDLYQGQVVAAYLIQGGKWYSEEKTTTSLSIINNGVDETWCVEFEIMPTTNQVVLKNSLGKVITVEASSTTTPVYINMMDKTVKQSARHAPINPNSRLFPLVKGANNLVLTGGTATIKYREVIAL